MKKIAIVTPELVGLFKNGGIGTNYFFRSRFLSRCLGYQVTILYTGVCAAGEAAAWREKYGPTGIRLEVLPHLSASAGWEAFHQRATAVHQWLAPQAWDEIHLPEYQANGFVCIQAKRAGLAYQNTRLVVSMHSATRWCREGMQLWSLDPVADAKLDYAEQYCCENADTLISPSRCLLGWAERKGWRLPANQFLLPHLYEKLELDNTPAASPNLRHLIFFGRLQTLKGLGVFCEAIERLAATGQGPARVDFLGKVGTHAGQPADQYIRHMSAHWPGTETQIHSDLDNFAAMQHIRRTGGLVVIASLRDNLPYTVIECIVNEVPFIAANVSGIPELADPQVLFQPEARALAAKLATVAELPAPAQLKHPYRLENARQRWQQFGETPFVCAPPPSIESAPKISVCIPCYNHGHYLPDVLASLARQTYQNFEVIVVDDGSTEARSQAAFDRVQKEYRQFRFFRQANSGVGAARNFAVAQATGEWLVFMDADNVAKETMLASFAHALQVSPADCATCHFDAFYDDVANLKRPPAYTYAPLGPCLEIGWRANIFGDANFVVKKTVFAELGGFATHRTGVEDWQFLIRLALTGFRQVVIPESLFWYRHLPHSLSRTSDPLGQAQAILETYREGLASWPAGIIETHAFSAYMHTLTGTTITIQQHAELSQLLRFLELPEQTYQANRHAPPSPGKTAAGRNQKGKFIKKLKKSCVKRLVELAGFIARH